MTNKKEQNSMSEKPQHSLYNRYKTQLISLRAQGMQISDINPVSALADMISDQLYHGQLERGELKALIGDITQNVWQKQASELAGKTNLSDFDPAFKAVRGALSGCDMTKPLYRAVFTAHPVFALQRAQSDALCDAACHLSADKNAVQVPRRAYQPRAGVTLTQEHQEAMQALGHARASIAQINDHLLADLAAGEPARWRDKLPVMLGVSTWVGYDLDGRSDISWLDTLMLRVREKQMALHGYQKTLQNIIAKGVTDSALETALSALAAEEAACSAALDDFTKLQASQSGAFDTSLFEKTFNRFTERSDKLVASGEFARSLQDIAKTLTDVEVARALMVLAADIATHGFGMGEVHLRINAVQLRNAMRAVDGRSLSSSDDSLSSRILMDRLASRIETEAPWQINFASIENEAATARRQLMLAAQFIKHIDSDQPVRLLIAECERPITFMSALYLAQKFGISDRLDISPLFETSFGLEHGAGMMAQLFEHEAVRRYIARRGRVAIQLGFSDAGRFMGQLAANLAIERLQVKLIKLVAQHFGSEIDLLMFNTHGDSLGRGCARPDMRARQDFILTPFTRHTAHEADVHIYHQSSFQGGDGYRLFGNQKLSDAAMSALVLAERQEVAAAWQNDPFYNQSDFALDLFLSLKNWHEKLFASADYARTLDVFGANLLPKTGSRPAKRVVQAGNERGDPSKIRAIPHNAILQQLGFLAIVVSGIGTAANVDRDQFAEIFSQSPRLQQFMRHVDEAKQHGSLNTLLAYARLMDNGFWIGRAYHGDQRANQRAYRQLASHLEGAEFATAMRQTAWRLRDDLIHLYRLFGVLDLSSPRTTGDQRLDLDLLHAVRLALIIDSLIRVAKAPRFAESNRHSNADLINAALRLDFETAALIIGLEFPETDSQAGFDLEEAENYSQSETQGYQATRAQLLDPILDNQQTIREITQLISGHYGAHG